MIDSTKQLSSLNEPVRKSTLLNETNYKSSPLSSNTSVVSSSSLQNQSKNNSDDIYFHSDLETARIVKKLKQKFDNKDESFIKVC